MIQNVSLHHKRLCRSMISQVVVLSLSIQKCHVRHIFMKSTGLTGGLLCIVTYKTFAYKRSSFYSDNYPLSVVICLYDDSRRLVKLKAIFSYLFTDFFASSHFTFPAMHCIVCHQSNKVQINSAGKNNFLRRMFQKIINRIIYFPLLASFHVL